jgi:hypothetical protein
LVGLKYYTISFAFVLIFIFVFPVGTAYGQAQQHSITVEFRYAYIIDHHSISDAEIEFFGNIGTPQQPVTNGCIIDQFNNCGPGFKIAYLTPGSGLDDAGENEPYYFTTPDRFMRLVVEDDGSFVIGSFAYNRDGPHYGNVMQSCDSNNNFCRGQGFQYWDLKSSAGDYRLGFLVYGWDRVLAYPILPR